MPIIRCLTFWSLFHVISIPFCLQTRLGHKFLNNSLYMGLVRQISFPLYFITVAHCCHLVLIEDITQMWKDACHIWKYYTIKCYNILVIFMKMTQYRYSPDCLLLEHLRHDIFCNMFQQIACHLYLPLPGCLNLSTCRISEWHTPAYMVRTIHPPRGASGTSCDTISKREPPGWNSARLILAKYLFSYWSKTPPHYVCLLCKKK